MASMEVFEAYLKSKDKATKDKLKVKLADTNAKLEKVNQFYTKQK